MKLKPWYFFLAAWLICFLSTVILATIGLNIDDYFHTIGEISSIVFLTGVWLWIKKGKNEGKKCIGRIVLFVVYGAFITVDIVCRILSFVLQ